MKKYLFLLLCTVILGGCCTTKTIYVPTPCPPIGAQPTLNDVTMTKFTIIDKNTGKEIIYYGFPEAEALKFRFNVEKLKEYGDRCFEKYKGK
jgi:hypothetical protein